MSVYLFFDRLQNGGKRLERYVNNDGSITVGDWVEKMCALYAGEEWFPAGLTRDTCTLTCQNGANINLKLGVSTLESRNGNPLTVAVRKKGTTCPQPSGIPHPRPVGLRMCGECKIEKVMKKDFGRRQWGKLAPNCKECTTAAESLKKNAGRDTAGEDMVTVGKKIGHRNFYTHLPPPGSLDIDGGPEELTYRQEASLSV